MTDNITKLMMIIVIVIMIVFVPSLMVQMRNDMVQGQMLLYETKFFIDTVTERGEIHPADIEELEVSINMYGGAFEAHIERQIRDTGEPEPEDVVPIYYRGNVSTKDPTEVLLRDGVRVHIEEIKPNKGIYQVMTGFLKPPVKFSMMGTRK